MCSKTCTKTLDNHSNSVNTLIKLNESTIASGSDDKSIKVWDLKSGTLIKTLLGHDDRVISVSISHDSKFIVSGSSDKTVKVWDLEYPSIIKPLEVN